MKYRVDIQLLRGISVTFVVLFHLGFNQFNAGFLGVDIFFVISGFLMAVLCNNSSAKEFFKRRASRLLPAYYLTITCTFITVYLITTPNETNQVNEQTTFSLFYLSNLGFWFKNSYFSKSDFNPLLHLWSLGVEIQFYLIVPLLIKLIQKRNYLLFVIGIGSIIACFYGITISPKTSFFITPFRIWEFIIGFIVAQYLSTNGNLKNQNNKLIGNLSFCAIMLVPFLPINGENLNILSGHPGLAALLITILTAFVLAFGLSKNFEASLLGKFFEMLGKYSYAVYLCHFPIIVIYNYQPFEGTITKVSSKLDIITIAILIIICTKILHYLAEVKLKKVKIVSLVFVFNTVIIAFLVTFPLLKIRHTTTYEREIFNANSDRSVYRCGKLIRIFNRSEICCSLNNIDIGSSTKKCMLVGNSHADSIKTSFKNIANKFEYEVYFLVFNIPLMPGGQSPETIINECIEKGISFIILHYSPNAITVDTIKKFVNLAEQNKIKVFFIDPVPVYEQHIPKALYLSYKTGVKLPQQSKEEYFQKNKIYFDEMLTVTNKNFKRKQIIDYFCIDTCKLTNEFGKPLYFDSGHLTLTGAKLLEDAFEEIFKQMETTE